MIWYKTWWQSEFPRTMEIDGWEVEWIFNIKYSMLWYMNISSSSPSSCMRCSLLTNALDECFIIPPGAASSTLIFVQETLEAYR
jgi:hypothetical protein